MGLRRTTALLTLTVAAFAASSAAAAPMVLMYGPKDSVKKIVAPDGGLRLPLDGRLHVAEPNGGHLWHGDADKPFRMDKITEEELIARGNETAMAAFLKSRLDNPCRWSWGSIDCRSGLLGIDEVGRKFSEPVPSVKPEPWKFVPRTREGQPGLEFSQAMEILANTPHPQGGNYAERIHIFVAPGMQSGIGTGLGAHFNLGKYGYPRIVSYHGVRRAFQLSGGVHLEMYHFVSGRRYPFTTREWKVYPYRFTQWLTKPGTKVVPDPALVAKTHFLMTNGMPKRVGTGIPKACYNSRTPQGCQWALASQPRNAAILKSGPGVYRMEGNEREWRYHLITRFYR